MQFVWAVPTPVNHPNKNLLLRMTGTERRISIYLPPRKETCELPRVSEHNGHTFVAYPPGASYDGIAIVMMVPIFVVEEVILPDSPAAVVASSIRRRHRRRSVHDLTGSALILLVRPQSLGHEVTLVKRRVVKDEQQSSRSAD